MLVAWWVREERATTTYKKPLFSAAWYMSQALSVSKGELVLVVVVAERGVGLVHEAKNYKLFPPS